MLELKQFCSWKFHVASVNMEPPANPIDTVSHLSFPPRILGHQRLVKPRSGVARTQATDSGNMNRKSST